MIREFALRQWLHLRSHWATPAWLDALPDEHKKIVASGPFAQRLRRLAAGHVGTFSWVMVPHEGDPEWHNGSMFLLDCGQGPFIVTAGHVYTGYMTQRDAARRIVCQIGDLEFHPEERLIDFQDPPDIATFRVTPDEITAIGKQVVTHAAQTWPPEPLPEGYAVLVSGFPGQERLIQLRQNLTPRKINFGYYYANTPITISVPNQISCRFERRYWVSSFPEGIPEPGYDLGGISGAPLLRPVYSQSRSTWIVQLAGIITQAHSDEQWEQVTAATAAHVLPDGRIRHRVL